MKVAYFVGSYRRFTGSQRSLHVLVGALRDRIDPLIVFPGEGEATRAFRELGVPVVVAPVPTAADAFGGSLLRAPFSRRALVAARLLPFTLRVFAVAQGDPVRKALFRPVATHALRAGEHLHGAPELRPGA